MITQRRSGLPGTIGIAVCQQAAHDRQARGGTVILTDNEFSENESNA
jgi:hypothetical protein